MASVGSRRLASAGERKKELCCLSDLEGYVGQCAHRQNGRGKPAVSNWTFAILMALAWLSYPVAGAASYTADVAEHKRPAGAGFSFLPELLVLPVVFLGLAELLDYFIVPWGRRTIGGLCLTLFVFHTFVILRARRRIRAASESTS